MRVAPIVAAGGLLGCADVTVVATTFPGTESGHEKWKKRELLRGNRSLQLDLRGSGARPPVAQHLRAIIGGRQLEDQERFLPC